MNYYLIAACCAAVTLGACQKKTETVAASDTAISPAAAPAPGASADAASTAAPGPAPSAADFLAKAAAGDMYEVAAAKIAEKRSKNADVVSFAKTMVTDHTQSTDIVKKAIADSGRSDLAPPASLPAGKQALIDALNGAAPGDFDKIYLDQQTAAHHEALALMTAESHGADVPQLKDAAGMILPVVQMHVEMLSKLEAK